MLRRPAAHEEVNNSFCLRRKMRRIEDAFERTDRVARRGQRVAIEQTKQRRPAKPKCEPAEKLSAIHSAINMCAVHKGDGEGTLIFTNLLSFQLLVKISGD